MSNARKVLIGSVKNPTSGVYISTDDFIAYLNALKLDIYEASGDSYPAKDIALLNKLIKVLINQRDNFRIA